MHTLIPYAAPVGPHCRDALQRLRLPHLSALLDRLSAQGQVHGSNSDLTPAHEHVMGEEAGCNGPDGLVAWAAKEASDRGLIDLHGAEGWAWVTPCHWEVEMDHVRMSDPVRLALTPHEADGFRNAMQDYFSEDHILLFSPAPGHTHSRWLAKGPLFINLPTASLDRVIGRTVDPWLPRQAQARDLRRLQNEMQMLLYTHPLNDQRARQHLPTVNAFWVSGTGNLPSNRATPEQLTLREALRTPALEDDAAAWVSAWHALDETTIAHELQRSKQGETVKITLGGPIATRTWISRPLGSFEKIKRRFNPSQPLRYLESL